MGKRKWITYAFCETSTASGSTPWHIRPLTKEGKRLGGGADTNALCGRAVCWDLESNPTVDNAIMDRICHKCRQLFLSAMIL